LHGSAFYILFERAYGARPRFFDPKETFSRQAVAHSACVVGSRPIRGGFARSATSATKLINVVKVGDDIRRHLADDHAKFPDTSHENGQIEKCVLSRIKSICHPFQNLMPFIKLLQSDLCEFDKTFPFRTL
jgi:hypothetical protein